MAGLAQISFKPVSSVTIALGATLVGLLVISGLVSGSEVAYFALTPQDKASLRDSENKKDKTILALIAEKQKLLATILIANNLTNISIVMLSAIFSSAIVDFGSATLLRFIFETIIITAVILLFGEIIPKVYATQHHVGFARLVAYPLQVAFHLFNPFSRLLMKSTGIVASRLAGKGQTVSQDDLEQALELTSDSMNDEKEMLEGIVKFMELDVTDLMTPRIDVVSVSYADSFDNVLKVIIESGYSRMPVIGDTPDDIKGIIYVKDILHDINSTQPIDWHKRVRRGFFIPETKKVNDLLTEFQSTKTHMAIIVDEYGCMQGIITLEDIMEEIVGDISDEQDEEERDWYKQPDGSYIFEGKISLNDFFKAVDIDSEIFDKVRGDAETLAGLLLEKNGLIPKKKDIIEIKHLKFEILSADNRKINKVKMFSPVQVSAK